MTRLRAKIETSVASFATRRVTIVRDDREPADEQRQQRGDEAAEEEQREHEEQREGVELGGAQVALDLLVGLRLGQRRAADGDAGLVGDATRRSARRRPGPACRRSARRRDGDVGRVAVDRDEVLRALVEVAGDRRRPPAGRRARRRSAPRGRAPERSRRRLRRRARSGRSPRIAGALEQPVGAHALGRPGRRRRRGRGGRRPRRRRRRRRRTAPRPAPGRACRGAGRARRGGRTSCASSRRLRARPARARPGRARTRRSSTRSPRPRSGGPCPGTGRPRRPWRAPPARPPQARRASASCRRCFASMISIAASGPAAAKNSFSRPSSRSLEHLGPLVEPAAQLVAPGAR